MELRRANTWSGLLAMLGLPAGLVVLGLAQAVFAPPIFVSLPLAAALGAIAGVAWSLGGGLESNVRQPLWMGAVRGVLLAVGAVAAIGWGADPGWPLGASMGLGLLGALPGAAVHALVRRSNGRPAVSQDRWEQLEP
ncbi:MAG: hypothetical protein GY913_19055 [Proteobacteria bacterium]|nr:hypothetical protein [Pseudomonadota bacterium]MCP4919008.1 hypothetical protein [Pseudomonadota bacterium]